MFRIKKNKSKNIAFTLVELLVVIFVIVLISTLVTVSFSNIKRNNRDAKRITDITEIQTALESYKFFEGSYPAELTAGQPLTGHNTGNTYMAMVPENPSYHSYSCPHSSYDYFYDTDDGKYKISFCLEGTMENYSAGIKCAISEGIVNGSCIPLTIIAGNPVGGQVGEVYSGHTFSALSGTEPYSFSVASGSNLPPGLSLSLDGNLTGTPTVYGDYNFFIEVNDAEAGVGQRRFSMTISPAILALGVSSPANGYEGEVYDGHTFTASGGVTPYIFSLVGGSLPTGLSLAPNGNLTGTPTVSNSYNFTIKVVDGASVEDTGEFNMLITDCGHSLVDSRDSQIYPTVQIGSQCWFARNLAYLPVVHSNSEFQSQGYNGQPGYGVYGYDGSSVAVAKSQSNYTTYGVLYNWFAGNVCPSGWHVPSDAEFTVLTDYLSSNSQYWCGGNSAQIAKSLASVSGWGEHPTSCRVGNDQASNNSSGLNVLPAGRRGTDGTFLSSGFGSYFWSSTYNIPYSIFRYLYYESALVSRDIYGWGWGFSIRCLKD